MQTNNGSFTKETDKLLFLHGYLSCGSSFIHQLKYFEKFFDVYAPDLKGFGDNLGMQKPYTLDDYIDSVEEFKYKNSIVKPHIVAHSFGGRIALKGTVTAPNFCDKLVLTGCAGLKPKLTVKKIVKRASFFTLSKFIDKSKLTKFYSKDYNALDGVLKQSFIKIVNEHLDYLLKDIENKTLIIFGEKDKETPLYMAKRLNKGIKNSHLKVIKGAGHFCFIDKPYAFNLLVGEFLF